MESTPGATVSFALNVLGEPRKFAVDPMTYTFGMNLDYIKSETIDRAKGIFAVAQSVSRRDFPTVCNVWH
jgi:hypothetical protein